VSSVRVFHRYIVPGIFLFFLELFDDLECFDRSGHPVSLLVLVVIVGRGGEHKVVLGLSTRLRRRHAAETALRAGSAAVCAGTCARDVAVAVADERGWIALEGSDEAGEGRELHGVAAEIAAYRQHGAEPR